MSINPFGTRLRCTEPDCPPLETVIALMHAGAAGPIQHKLHKPLPDVSREDVLGLAARAQGEGV